MTNRSRVIAFIVASPFDLLNLVGFASVFSYPRIDGKPAYSIKILTADSEARVSSIGGIAVSNCIPISEYIGPIDTLVAISGESARTNLASGVTCWIRENAGRCRRIAGVGSGTFMLASSGLLDGRRVTTHWNHIDRLAKLHPYLRVESAAIFVKDGNVYSTAGVTAGIDLALTLVEEDLGNAAAMSIARELVLYIRRAGNEAQCSTLLAQQARMSDTPMCDLPAWAKARLNQRLDVCRLAEVAGMTPRTFARQFKSRFRMTPARWVQSLRVETACSYLMAEELPIKAITKLTGFRDEQSLRRAFLQQLSITPSEYRHRLELLNSEDRDVPSTPLFRETQPRNV